MLGALLPDILQSEVVDYEGKRDEAGQVRSEARVFFGGSVSVGDEDGCKFRVGEDSGLGETVHPLSYFEENPAVGGYKLL